MSSTEIGRTGGGAGAPEADALTAVALALGQAVGVDDATLAYLFTNRGNCHGHAGRPEAASCYREAARLATQAGDTVRLGRGLVLSDHVCENSRVARHPGSDWASGPRPGVGND